MEEDNGVEKSDANGDGAVDVADITARGSTGTVLFGHLLC
jgi:hypothetical protein